MADFITSGPIGFSGSYPGSVYSFITDAGGTVSTAGGISLSGLYASANTAGISLSGSATYASPHRMYNFYGMSTTNDCCLSDEDLVCFALESDGTDLDLECCPTCIGSEPDSADCVLAEDGASVDAESCTAGACCIALVDDSCLVLVDGVTELDLEVCP